MPSVVINHDALQRFRKRTPFNDDDRELARRIGVSASTVSRVLSGKLAPSNQFIAGTLRTFGEIWFNELFSVVDD